MENFLVSAGFLASLACLLAIGHLLGHILKLDWYDSDTPKKRKN
jgi:hypothetical protein